MMLYDEKSSLVAKCFQISDLNFYENFNRIMDFIDSESFFVCPGISTFKITNCLSDLYISDACLKRLYTCEFMLLISMQYG